MLNLWYHKGCPPLAEDSYWHGYMLNRMVYHGAVHRLRRTVNGTVMLISPRHHEWPRKGTVQSRVCMGNHYTRMVMAPARNLAGEQKATLSVIHRLPADARTVQTTHRLRRIVLGLYTETQMRPPTLCGGRFGGDPTEVVF